MQTSSLDGGTFEKWTGIPWTAGLSRYRDGDAMNIHWEKISSISSRWFFEIKGVQYSAKTIAPHITGIQMHVEEPSDHDDGQYDYGCP